MENWYKWIQELKDTLISGLYWFYWEENKIQTGNKGERISGWTKFTNSGVLFTGKHSASLTETEFM